MMTSFTSSIYSEKKYKMTNHSNELIWYIADKVVPQS